MKRFEEELKDRLKQVKSSEATEIKVYEVLFKCWMFAFNQGFSLSLTQSIFSQATQSFNSYWMAASTVGRGWNHLINGVR